MFQLHSEIVLSPWPCSVRHLCRCFWTPDTPSCTSHTLLVSLILSPLGDFMVSWNSILSDFQLCFFSLFIVAVLFWDRVLEPWLSWNSKSSVGQAGLEFTKLYLPLPAEPMLQHCLVFDFWNSSWLDLIMLMEILQSPTGISSVSCFKALNA